MKPKKQRTVQYTVRLKEDTAEVLKAIADRAGLSPAAWISTHLDGTLSGSDAKAISDKLTAIEADVAELRSELAATGAKLTKYGKRVNLIVRKIIAASRPE
jgi:hypothetical protein